MDRETLTNLLPSIEQCRELLNSSVATAQKGLDHSEFVSYRRSIAKLMDIMREEILNPAYRQFPDLAPADWFGAGHEET